MGRRVPPGRRPDLPGAVRGRARGPDRRLRRNWAKRLVPLTANAGSSPPFNSCQPLPRTRLPPASFEPALAQNLTAYARTQPVGGLLILISDLLDAAASAEAGQGAVRLAEGLNHLTPPRWQVIVMHVLSQEEIQPTLSGDFDLQDMETGESLPFHFDQATLGQYRLRMRRWCSELELACGQRGATYARIPAEWPLEQAVIPYLRRRGSRPVSLLSPLALPGAADRAGDFAAAPAAQPARADAHFQPCCSGAGWSKAAAATCPAAFRFR